MMAKIATLTKASVKVKPDCLVYTCYEERRHLYNQLTSIISKETRGKYGTIDTDCINNVYVFALCSDNIDINLVNLISVDHVFNK